MRKLHAKRYQKQVPVRPIQVDVKYLILKVTRGEKHTQASAIDLIDHLIEKVPFRMREVRTDEGHEFQAKFHWQIEDLGVRQAYIKRGTPLLNDLTDLLSKNSISS